MILEKEEICVEKSKKFEESFFKIKDQALILDVLRNKLYSSGPKAIVQEIGCNGIDAHREAGIANRPIEIGLPNNLVDQFYIKDFGWGLTPDEIREVYTQYGASTKRHTNAYMGGFGIGSKSVYAYTDTFSVTSITQESDERFRREYVCFIDETRIGKIALVSEQKTKEETGLKVSFAVKDGDANQFADLVNQVFYLSDVKPIVKGREFKWREITKVLAGDDWFISNTSDRPIATINGIPYTIDTYQFKNEKYEDVSNMSGMVMSFGVGELTVTANRESLEYKDKTIKTIVERSKKIMKDMSGVLQEKFKTIDCYWQALSEYSVIPYFIRNKNPKVIWNGIDISDVQVIPYQKDSVQVDVWMYSKFSERLKKQERLVPSKDVLVVINDTTYKGVSKAQLRNLMDKQTVKVDKVYLINPPAVKEDFEKWQKATNMHLAKLPLLSSEPRPKVVRTPSTQKTRSDVEFFMFHGYTSWTKDDKIDFNDEGVYVIGRGVTGTIKPEKPEKDHINTIFRYSHQPIHSIEKRWVNKLGPKWKTFGSLVNDIYCGIEKKYKLSDFENLSYTIAHFLPKAFADKIDSKKIKDKEIKEYIEVSQRINKISSEIISVNDYIKTSIYCNNPASYQTPDKTIVRLRSYFYVKYPLVDYCDKGSLDRRIVMDDLVTYFWSKN